jgi:hypothetical protein
LPSGVADRGSVLSASTDARLFRADHLHSEVRGQTSASASWHCRRRQAHPAKESARAPQGSECRASPQRKRPNM